MVFKVEVARCFLLVEHRTIGEPGARVSDAELSRIPRKSDNNKIR